SLSQIRQFNEPREMVGQCLDIATRREQSVYSIPHQIRDTASSIRDDRNVVGPGFEQYKTERVRPTWQRKNIDASKKIALFRIRQCAEQLDRTVRPMVLPKSLKVRHRGPGEDNANSRRTIFTEPRTK